MPSEEPSVDALSTTITSVTFSARSDERKAPSESPALWFTTTEATVARAPVSCTISFDSSVGPIRSAA